MLNFQWNSNLHILNFIHNIILTEQSFALVYSIVMTFPSSKLLCSLTKRMLKFKNKKIKRELLRIAFLNSALSCEQRKSSNRNPQKVQGEHMKGQGKKRIYLKILLLRRKHWGITPGTWSLNQQDRRSSLGVALFALQLQGNVYLENVAKCYTT